MLEPGVQTTRAGLAGPRRLLGRRRAAVGADGSLALRLANQLLGNAEGAAALECTASGPTLRFNGDTVHRVWRAPHAGRAGRRARCALADASPCAPAACCGSAERQGAGLRTYLAVPGGFDVPDYLGSQGHVHARPVRRPRRAHAARRRRAALSPQAATPSQPARAARSADSRATATHWEIGVLYGPHGAPDFFTPQDIDTFFATDWEVHYNSSRTGVRLIGPKPQWARSDGGEAGLHPSNIHDNAYAIGAIDFTGDMPVILGPDGPSLGGFVCPAVIVAGRAVEDGPAAARRHACASCA